MKVDLKTAYDTMDWFLIKDMLIVLGFPHHFVKIVFTCISTASFSLVVNGVPLLRLHAKGVLDKRTRCLLYYLLLGWNISPRI